MKRTFVLLLAGLMLLCAGCSADRGTEQGIRFYYAVSSERFTGSSLGNETDASVELTVPAVMKRLFSGPQDEQFLQTFPNGTSVLDWRLEEGVLKLNLSEAFGRLSGISLTQAVYCIVLTVTQLDGVDVVSIAVNGNGLPGISGDGLSAGDAVLKGETEDPITVSSQLYFPLSDHSGLGVEYREFEVTDDTLLAEANGLLEQLIDGPKESEMISFLAGVGRLEAIAVIDQVCYVEMDSQSLACLCGESSVIPLYLYALVDSLTELEGIESVSFLINGDPVDGWLDAYKAVYVFN